MDRAYIEARIASIKSRIELYEAASIAFATDGALQSYTLDTGQSRQTVTRTDPASLERIIQSLTNQLASYEARLNAMGSVIGVPRF